MNGFFLCDTDAIKRATTWERRDSHSLAQRRRRKETNLRQTGNETKRVEDPHRIKMRASLLMTSSALLLVSVLVSVTDGLGVGGVTFPTLPKVNLFSELQKAIRSSQNFVAEQMSKAAAHVHLPTGPQKVDLRPLLEMSRRKMRSGWPSLNIPPLEPLSLAYVSLDTQDDNVSLQGYLNDSQVTGISAVVARNLTLNLVNHDLNFGLVFLQLTSSGRYKLNGTLPSRLVVDGQGSYSVTAWNLVLAGSLRLKFVQKSVQVDDVTVRLSVDRLKMDLENFLGGGDVGRVMCEAFSEAAPAILDREREKVSTRVSRQLKEVLNRKLAAVEWNNQNNLLSLFKLPYLPKL